MNRNFLTDAELAAMDLPLAMRAAACFSGLTDREIISRMGWEPRNGYRLLAPHDDYWPSVPSLPRLCRVLGNDVLPRWLAIKSRVDMALPCRELTPEALLGELGDLFGRTGEVARRGQRSLEDGLITVDDIVDVIQDENTEDMEKMAAMAPSEKPYLKTSPWDLAKHRILWLLALMLSATITGRIITGFEELLAQAVVLTAFIPMLMDTGGNCGSQASVTVIRGISLDEIEFSDLLRVIWKEIRVAVLCAAVLSAANFVKLLLVDKMIFGNPITMTVAAVICLTLIVTVFAAKLVGCTLPLLAKKIGFDPAVMASPFISTIVDAISLIIYFRFASLLLGI